jgi:hypothetical protein
VFHPGETARRDRWHTDQVSPLELSALDEGLIVGILIGEGHFGGDGRQPQITLRMHVRHEALLRWLHARIPRSRLYGPYHHGDRHYFQWTARGPALTQDLMPILERRISPDLDGHTYARLVQMRERYADVFDRAAARAAREAATDEEMASPATYDEEAGRDHPAAADSPALRGDAERAGRRDGAQVEGAAGPDPATLRQAADAVERAATGGHDLDDAG